MHEGGVGLEARGASDSRADRHRQPANGATLSRLNPGVGLMPTVKTMSRAGAGVRSNGSSMTPCGADATACAFEWRVTARLWSIGGLALALGLLVYAADRDPARAMLFPALAVLQSGPLFGAMGSWLPSFVHPFAFSLFAAAARPRCARPACGACAAWWAVNVLLELAQHQRISASIAEALQCLFGQSAVGDALANYILRGTFDRADILAATAGSLAAAVLILHPGHDRGRHEHAHQAGPGQPRP